MAVTQPVRKKRKLSVLALLAVLAIAFAAYFIASNQLPLQARQALGIKTPEQLRTIAFAANNSQDLIWFVHPDWGFNITYPSGYTAEADEEAGVYFRAVAVVPGWTAETVEVYASNGSLSQADFNDFVASQNSSEIQFAGTKEYGGRQAYVLNLKTANQVIVETDFVRTAFYACQTPAGDPYSAVVIFTVPEMLASDLELADFVLSTFKC